MIWHVNDKTNLTVGLRYTQDEKEFTWINGRMRRRNSTRSSHAGTGGLLRARSRNSGQRPIASRTSCSRCDTPAGGVTKKDSWDDVSPRVVLDYKITPDVMWFGSLAKGYKAGGYNSVEVDSKFDNEDVWNFETGIKSVFPNAGVVLNASTFYYVYDNKQAISLVTASAGLRPPAVPGRHQRRTGVGPRRRCDMEGDRSLHAVRKRRVHRCDLQEQDDAGR